MIRIDDYIIAKSEIKYIAKINIGAVPYIFVTLKNGEEIKIKYYDNKTQDEIFIEINRELTDSKEEVA